MTYEFCKRVGTFLVDYIDIKDPSMTYGDRKVIESGIYHLIREGVYTAKQLQKQMLREQSVLMPLYMIEDITRR